MARTRWTAEEMPDQTGRIAIVTGANSGIGFETAKALALKGAHTIVASRSAERGGKAVAELQVMAPGATVELMLLDLASLASIDAFAAAYRERFDRLDLLINNAGVMMLPERRQTADGFEMQFGTNHLGHFALTMRLIDWVAATAGARVVNVSSTAQRFAGFDASDLNWESRKYKPMPAYAQSKTANMLFTLELQKRLRALGADTLVVAAHPGWTATNLQKEVSLFEALNPIFAMKPWKGALPTLYAACAPEAKAHGYYGPDGLWNMRGYPAANKISKSSLDEGSARKLWEASEALTGLSLPALPKVAAAA